MSLGKPSNSPSKAQNAAITQQMAIQSSLAALTQGQVAKSNAALAPAADYWKALLEGGQPARVAVGPIAQEVQAGSEATRNSIMQALPRGGERNLAVARNYTDQAAQIARLYAGVQPTAADRLTSIASVYGGQGVGFAGAGAPAVGSSISSLSSQINAQNENNLATAQGFGSLLYNFTHGQLPTTPPFNPTGSGGKKG